MNLIAKQYMIVHLEQLKAIKHYVINHARQLGTVLISEF